MSANKPKFNRGPRHRGRGKSARPQAAAEHYLFGLHTVAAALTNPKRTLTRLLITPNAERRLGEALAGATVETEQVSVKALDKITGPDAVHQGAVLFCEPLPEPDAGDLAQMKRIVALDQITDPHNVGAILRSCAAFAVDAVLMTARHSPQESAVLAKSASGALDHVPLVRVQNLVRALEELQVSHRLIGLDSEAEVTLEEAVTSKSDSPDNIALLLGAEGKGLRQSTRATCTTLARVDMPGAIASLNVSNAAVLALYIVDRGGG